MTTEASDLARLARPFPRELVQRDPGGNSYVAHENVTQWLLGIVGPFSFELVEIIRGDVLNEYIRHVGSAVFACPPGVRAGGWWGQTLFG